MTTTISREDLLRFLGECGHSPLILALSQPAGAQETQPASDK